MFLYRNDNKYELPDIEKHTVQLREIEVGDYFYYFKCIWLQLSEEDKNGGYSILNISTGKVYEESGAADVEPLNCEVKLSRVQFYEGKESESENED